MELTLTRRYKGKDYTIGSLFVDGVYFCDTLEDADRGLYQPMPLQMIKSMKIYGKTAIPCGCYRVDMTTVSAKFQTRSWAKPYGGKLPRLQSVPGFDGVLIHPGNTADDTLGCVLVGQNKVKGQVINSASTFHALMRDHLLPAQHRGEIITLNIR